MTRRASRRLPYIAMLRIVYDAPNDAHANGTAEWLRQQMEEHQLDPGDSCDVTQVIRFGDASPPDERINVFKKARNELCRLHYRDALDLARWLDMMIWKLQHLVAEDDIEPPNYNQNRIIEIFEMVRKGEDPLI